MIRLSCTGCKQTLTIDDAFAGGVCRCQHCGTIQTVPKHLKGQGQKQAPAAAAAPGKTQKSLYQNRARVAGQGSGLDELGDVVASSGLAENIRRSRGQSGRTEPPKNQLTPILLICGAVIAVLLVVILVLAFRGGGGGGGKPAANAPAAPSDQPTQAANPTPQPPPAATPTICGLPLEGDSVAYLLDNGGSAQDLINSMTAAALHSAESLGEGRKFQIMFWRPDSPAYPDRSSLAYANADNIKQCQSKVGDVTGFGATSPEDSLKRAILESPATIVLITTKADQIDKDTIAKMDQIRGSSKVRIDLIAIHGIGDNSVLKGFVEKTGGSVKELTEAEVRSFGG